MDNLPVSDIAYLAGLLDGEGSICILKRKNSSGNLQYWLEVSIGNTHRGVLDWVHQTFGGHISDNAERYTPRNHQTWRWRVSSEKACQILEMLLPFLHIKKQQATLAIGTHRHMQSFAANSHNPLTTEELAWRATQKQMLSNLNLRHRPLD